MVDLKKLLGSRIKDLRVYHKITQEALCEKLEISPQALSNIENGHSFPSCKLIEKILKIFNIMPDVLFSANGNDKEFEFQILYAEYQKLSEKQRKSVFEIVKNINEMQNG